jgi:hypothetical protein
MYYYFSDNTEIQQSYKDIDNDNDLLCVICLSQPTDCNQLISLQDNNQYIINCLCNVHLHNTCLKTWVDKASSCPICRKKISINKLMLHENVNLFLLYIIYSWFKFLHLVKCIIILNIIFYISDNILYIFSFKTIIL